MKKILLALLLFPAVAFATNVSVLWDPNPVEENVTVYEVMADGAVVWTGSETTATVALAPGTHVLAAVAVKEGVNPDGSTFQIRSEASESIEVPVPSAPGGFRVTVTVNVIVQ